MSMIPSPRYKLSEIDAIIDAIEAARDAEQ
jgi:hypothetical protein